MSMLEQVGVSDAMLEDNVILVHGDLSTKEQIDALKCMRTIEHSTKNRLDFVVFVPGLFYLKMAATDVFWRAHVQLLAGRTDSTGFFEYVCHLRPKETGKFTSAPGFCRLLEVGALGQLHPVHLPALSPIGRSSSIYPRLWSRNTYLATALLTSENEMQKIVICALRTMHFASSMVCFTWNYHMLWMLAGFCICFHTGSHSSSLLGNLSMLRT